MAEIKPFRALRFDTQAAGNIQQLTCPPYDIISEEPVSYTHLAPYPVRDAL